jgi:pilus assembly protein CpaF
MRAEQVATRDAATLEAEARVEARFRAERDPLHDPATRVEQLLEEEAPLLTAAQRRVRARRLTTHLVGLGLLQALLDDHEVSDVLVNGPGTVWVERAGRLEPTSIRMERDEILRTLERLVAPLGLRADRAHPVVDARLPDGTRVSAVLEPLAVDGPLLALRRHRSQLLPLEDFADPETTAILRAAVGRGDNVVVFGATGAGKTTLLNSLGALVDPRERVVVIEDVAELRLPGEHVVRLETRPGTSEGVGRVTMAELVRAALRLRPDRLVVGEVRGAEALDMVWALSTGHRGCMSTVHANEAADALGRLETMMILALGEGVPLAAVRRQLVSAVDLLVGVERVGRGGRRVRSVHRCGSDALERLR